MRWFKHLSNAAEDEKLSEILDEHGPEGYGIYWIILEKISFLMDKSSKTSARYSVKKWSKFCGKSPKVFRKFLESFQELSLFRVEICKKNSDFLIIDCPNLLKYRDEYSKKSGQSPDNNRIKSGESQDQDRDTETKTETELKLKRKKERDFREKAFKKWWPTYPMRNGKRVGKQEALEQFIKLIPDQYEELKKATSNYSTEDFPKDACRFLKKEYWKDWINVEKQIIKPNKNLSVSDHNAIEFEKLKIKIAEKKNGSKPIEFIEDSRPF